MSEWKTMQCVQCGKMFKTMYAQTLCCSDRCKKDRENENNRNRIKSPFVQDKAKSNRSVKKDSVSGAIHRLEEYNRANGTNYSYGTAVAKEVI